MPTPVQLSTVGQPLIQGNHKLHVIEAPFRLRVAHSQALNYACMHLQGEIYSAFLVIHLGNRWSYDAYCTSLTVIAARAICCELPSINWVREFSEC